MRYNYPEHYTKDVYTAIKLAEKLKAKGEYDFFRGQRHTFEIQPSIFRYDVDRKEAVERLRQFDQWVHNTPELISLHNNPNAILAVAQHYGMKTNLLDFSHSPNIAGFFATDGGKQGDTGTIICLNKKRFEESWKDLNEKHFADKGIYLAEIIEIDVKNLWRLQAQQGLFLQCRVDYTLLEMFSCLLHINFPQEENIKLLKSELVYPKEKSHLEVLLDQYFLIDSYPERQKTLNSFFGPPVIKITEDDILKEVQEYFVNDQLPSIHNSWVSEKNQWIIEPDERHSADAVIAQITIVLPSAKDVDEFELNIRTQLDKVFGTFPVNKKSVSWNIISEKGLTLYIDSEGSITEKKDEWTEFKMEEMVNSIYSGMRNLPYSEADILISITRYLIFAKFRIHKIAKDVEGIELEGGRVRGRGFCSRQRIKDALRSDYFRFIKPDRLNSNGELDFRDILFTARKIKHSFEFDKFVKLFVDYIIPTQAVVAVEGLVIIVNPMRVDVLGES